METLPSALQPENLIGEISLLLDFLSGRSNRALSGTGEFILPKGFKTRADAIKRYFEITVSYRSDRNLGPDELRFLLEMRDYLNLIASPTSGTTIGFSTLVTREQADDHTAMGDARVAFPQFRKIANRMRLAMRALQYIVIFVTILISVLAAYVFWGNLIVTRLSEFSVQTESLDAQIEAKEEVTTTHLAGSTGVERYCPKPVTEESMITDAGRAHICIRWFDLQRKRNESYSDLIHWITIGINVAHNKRATIQTAAAVLAVLNGYVIPLLMGFLGSSAFVLRTYLRNLGDRLLRPRDFRSYGIRVVLGTLCGLTIGFFLTPGLTVAHSPGGPATVVNVTTPAAAFLAGYSVEVVFRFFDFAATQVFPGDLSRRA